MAKSNCLQNRVKSRFDKSIEDFNRAIELDPKNLSALRNRGYAYIKTGKFREASENLQAAVDLGPENAVACYVLGVAYSRLGNRPRAIFYLKKASSLGSKEAVEFLKTIDGLSLERWPRWTGRVGGVNKVESHRGYAACMVIGPGYPALGFCQYAS